jgi:plastocyanin
MQPGRPRLIVVLVASWAMAAPAEAATIQIVMQNLDISPAEVSAKVGDTIEWTNKDIVAHTATARNGDFDVMLQPNKTASFVLKKVGAVDYYCRFHPNMKAALKIEQ